MDAAGVDHSVVDAFWASVFIALFGAIGWLVKRGFKRMDDSHERAEKKFQDTDDNVADIRYHTKLPPWRSDSKQEPRD